MIMGFARSPSFTCSHSVGVLGVHESDRHGRPVLVEGDRHVEGDVESALVETLGVLLHVHHYFFHARDDVVVGQKDGGARRNRYSHFVVLVDVVVGVVNNKDSPWMDVGEEVFASLGVVDGEGESHVAHVASLVDENANFHPCHARFST